MYHQRKMILDLLWYYRDWYSTVNMFNSTSEAPIRLTVNLQVNSDAQLVWAGSGAKVGHRNLSSRSLPGYMWSAVSCHSFTHVSSASCRMVPENSPADHWENWEQLASLSPHMVRDCWPHRQKNIKLWNACTIKIYGLHYTCRKHYCTFGHKEVL